MTRAEFFQGLGKTIVFLFKALTWIVPIGALVVAVYFLVRPAETDQQLGRPEVFYKTYTQLNVDYTPASGRKASRTVLRELTEKFAKTDREWFEDNVDFLAYMGFNQLRDPFLAADPDQRANAAFRFILQHGPTELTTVQKVEMSKDGQKATLHVSGRSRSFLVPIVSEGKTWKISGAWGIPQKYASELSKFRESGLK